MLHPRRSSLSSAWLRVPVQIQPRTTRTDDLIPSDGQQKQARLPCALCSQCSTTRGFSQQQPISVNRRQLLPQTRLLHGAALPNTSADIGAGRFLGPRGIPGISRPPSKRSPPRWTWRLRRNRTEDYGVGGPAPSPYWKSPRRSSNPGPLASRRPYPPRP